MYDICVVLNSDICIFLEINNVSTWDEWFETEDLEALPRTQSKTCDFKMGSNDASSPEGYVGFLNVGTHTTDKLLSASI